MPIIGEVVEALPEKPFLCLKMEFDPALIASICVEAGILPARSEASVNSVALGKLSEDLLDAFLRLSKLFGKKDDYKMISPLVTREIIYRLLKSDQGPRIRQLANFGEQTYRITKAVHYLQQKFKKSLRVEDLASELNMAGEWKCVQAPKTRNTKRHREYEQKQERYYFHRLLCKQNE